MNARSYDRNSADYRDTLDMEQQRAQEVNSGLSMRSSDATRPNTLSGQATPPAEAVAGNLARSSAVPADARESLAQWYDERNRIQDTHDAEERAWLAQRQLQDETDDGRKSE